MRNVCNLQLGNDIIKSVLVLAKIIFLTSIRQGALYDVPLWRGIASTHLVVTGEL